MTDMKSELKRLTENGRLENLIDGLERCSGGLIGKCKECPFRKELGCLKKMEHTALGILKALKKAMEEEENDGR